MRWEIKDQRLLKTVLLRVSCNLGLKRTAESVLPVRWSVFIVGSASPSGNHTSGKVSGDISRMGKIPALIERMDCPSIEIRIVGVWIKIVPHSPGNESTLVPSWWCCLGRSVGIALLAEMCHWTRALRRNISLSPSSLSLCQVCGLRTRLLSSLPLSPLLSCPP